MSKSLKGLQDIHLIAVVWDDANYADDESDSSLSRGIAVGHLYKETARSITIALEKFFDDDDDYRRFLTIPKSCIYLRFTIDFQCDIDKLKVTNPEWGRLWRRALEKSQLET